MKGLSSKIYTSSIRSFVRKIKIFHWVFFVIGKMRGLLYLLEYRFSKPSTLFISAGSKRVSFLIDSFEEFVRVKAIGSEKKILNRFLAMIKPGDVIYDIGASIGLYTIPMAHIAGDGAKIIAFEPEPQSRERLLQNLALNGLNAKVFDIGLGDKVEQKSLVLTGHSFVSGAHGFFYKEQKGVSLSRINIMPGDQFAREMGLPLPNIVKIDVEGFEYEVLLGLRGTLTKTKRCAVLVEVHFGVLESRKMVDAPKKIERFFEVLGFDKLEWIDYSHLLALKNY